MDFSILTKRAEKFAIENSPVILTGIGVIGTVATAYLTGKASFKARDIIAKKQTQINLNEVPQRQLTNKEKVNLVWTGYLPPAGAMLVTVAAILGANHINARRMSAMVAAYTISQKAYDEYKDKVAEKIGVTREQGVRDEVNQDRVNNNPVGNREVIITGDGEALCYDQLMDRWFRSSMENMKRAQNDSNFQLSHDGWVSLSDFYLQLGLKPTAISDGLGWTADKPIEVNIGSAIHPSNQQPVLVLDFAQGPKANFRSFR